MVYSISDVRLANSSNKVRSEETVVKRALCSETPELAQRYEAYLHTGNIPNAIMFPQAERD
jgi:hypothetical protein